MKIIIDPYRGGADFGKKYGDVYEKDVLLDISKYMNLKFKENNINSFLTREGDVELSDSDRNKIIGNKISNGDLVIQNRLSENGEFNIIYPLRMDDSLVAFIDKNLNMIGYKVDKYFQRRLPSNTSLDYYSVIRENNPYNVLIIEYVDVNDYKKIISSIVDSISKYYDKGNYYVVKSGDSLYSIANKFKTTVDEIKRLNNLKGNLLSIGQKLIIPKNDLGDNDNNDLMSKDKYFTYVVKSGDSLYGIGKKYDMSVDDIKILNNLSGNLLSIGQKLIIPKNDLVDNDNNDLASKDKYFTYVVKSGDSLYGIGKKYDVSVADIKKINNLSGNLLSIGQKLIIPKSDFGNNDNNGVVNENKYFTYVVKSGDSLYGIGKKYDVSVDDIKKINNLNSNNLSIGMNLKIPV